MSRNVARYVPSTHVFLNLPFPKVRYEHPRDGKCKFTPVPYRFKFAFRDFVVKEWKEFNKEAAKVWMGNNVKNMDDRTIQLLDILGEDQQKPKGEAELRASFHGNVLNVLNRMTDHAITWGFGDRQKLDCEPSCREPDLRCETTNAGSSSSQTRDNVNIPIITGELKVPSCLRLGSELTPKGLTKAFRASNFLRDESLNPFFQALSYGLYTSKGVSLLTNYDEMRFFQINIGAKEILMSPLVKIDQLLDVKHGVPHAAQTLLFMNEIEQPKRNEYSTGLANDLVRKGDRMADEYEKKKAKEEKEKKEKEKKEKKSSRGSSSKDKGSSSGGKKHADVESLEIFSPVSRVLQKCKMLGTVGMGVTGELTECDFNGMKVVVKVGQIMSHSDERDCFFHVKQEAKIYEVLKELQGRVIPRMVVAGLERYYTPSAMVLITEKVGMLVEEEDDGRILVDGQELDEENLRVFEEKGLEGLRTLHEHSVVHYDSAARNTRVEMRDGKIDRVWWVDLGDACEIDEEAGKVRDAEGYRGDYPKRVAIDLDLGVFEGSIQKAVDAINNVPRDYFWS